MGGSGRVAKVTTLLLLPTVGARLPIETSGHLQRWLSGLATSNDRFTDSNYGTNF
jgi:outer membrane biogenesis lipoprotein LolB